MDKGILSFDNAVLILTGIVVGTVARIITLVTDYRQIPSVPNGVFSNLVAGFVAAALGAVAIPAIIAKDFTAITFLALAIQHFRDIRKMEKDSLESLEKTDLTKRGAAYIDGISKTYEARNYISLMSALMSVFLMKLSGIDNIPLKIITGFVSGIIVVYIIKYLTDGKHVGDICNVKQGEITVEGSELYVDGMYVTSVLGLDRSRERMLKEGLAVVLEPKDPIFRLTLDNYGQRQAILYEAVRALGIKRYHFTRKNYQTGKIIVALVPLVRDIELFKKAVQNTPILENSRKIRRLMSK